MQVGEVVEDQLLRQLLVAWLAPSPAAISTQAGAGAACSGGAQQGDGTPSLPGGSGPASAAQRNPAAPGSSPAVAAQGSPPPLAAQVSPAAEPQPGSGSPRPQARQLAPPARDLAHSLQQQLPNLRTCSAAPDVERAAGGPSGGGCGQAGCCRLLLGGLACGAVEDCCREPQPRFSPIEVSVSPAACLGAQGLWPVGKTLRPVASGENPKACGHWRKRASPASCGMNTAASAGVSCLRLDCIDVAGNRLLGVGDCIGNGVDEQH